MAATQQEPGAEFLLRRLARATAIPAAERPPDVAGFVESVQLLREACDLLPLTADGGPVLSADSPAARQQVQLAFAKLVRAVYVASDTPQCDRPYDSHRAAYTRWLLQQHYRQGQAGGCSQLEEALMLFASSIGAQDAVVAATFANQAAAMLADAATRQAVESQLQAMASASGLVQPPLSVKQLRYVCCAITAQSTSMLANEQPSPGGLEREAHASVHARATYLQALQQAGRSRLDQLLLLDPEDPNSHFAAAAAAANSDDFQAAIHSSLRAFQLAQEQRRHCRAVTCAQAAMMYAGSLAVHVGTRRAILTSNSRGALEGVVETYPRVLQALRSCSPALPRLWVEKGEGGGEMVEAIRAQLHEVLQGQRWEIIFPSHDEMQQAMQAARGVLTKACDGCGRISVGLRNCSRCKKARYCSTECQHQHWRVHKRDCRPA